jgi:hypothetical protein
MSILSFKDRERKRIFAQFSELYSHKICKAISFSVPDDNKAFLRKTDITLG